MMRRQRLLRGTSNHALCIFCASRFLGQELRPQASRVPSRRYLNTSRSSGQSAAAAAQTRPEHTGDGSGATAVSEEWTHYSSLTPSERAEKDRRMQARRAEEEAERQRQAEENERRREANRAREVQREQQRIQEMKQQEAMRAQRQREADAEQQQRHSAEMERRRSEAETRRLQSERARAASAEQRESRNIFRGQRTNTSSRSPKEPSMAIPSFSASSAPRNSTTTLPWEEPDESEIKPLQYRSAEDHEAPPRSRQFDIIGKHQSKEDAQDFYNQRKGTSQNLFSKHVRPNDRNPAEASPQRGKGELFYRMRGSAYGERPSRPDVNPKFLENEYLATILDNSGGQQPRQPIDSNNQEGGEWQHLNRRNSGPPPPPPASTQQARPRQNDYSDDWIDRNFAEHRSQRRRYPPQPFVSGINPTDIEFRNRPAQKPMICGRCNEEGHTARQCTGPVICKVCGGKGHVAKVCPSNQTTRQVDDPFAEPSNVFRVAKSTPGHTDNPFAEPSNVFRGTQTTPSHLGPFEKSDSEQRTSPSPFDSKDDSRRITWSPFGGQESGQRRPASQQSEERTQPERQAWEPPVTERIDERRASRSRRGFEEAQSDALEERDDRRPRRQSRRIMEVENDEAADDAASLREERVARKNARKAARKAQKSELTASVNLPEFISVSNLAQTLNVRYENLLSQLEELGYDDVFPGKILNAETSGMIAMEYNFEPIFEEASAEKLEEEERDLKARPEVGDKTFLPTRPPVVTIMGHVDHGKTTILDYLRKSSVAAGEAGGITQHIGAFSVPLSASGKTITFLDTPGHAAFLAMRQRGANVTDIVILVVAADDSVKPQTLESIRCAREANVPILVAINKVDKEEADIQRVKQDLARNGVEIEDFGGDTQVVCVSGKTGLGMEELEEAAVTLSEILDHRAEADGDVEGWIVEATTKKAGRVATVLVKRGTLRPGAVIVAGKTWAKVRTLKNEGGQELLEVGPGMPVEVDGWRDQAVAGDEVLQASGEQKAVDVVEFRIEKEERARTAQDMEVINEARRLEQEKRLEEKRIAEAAKEKAGADHLSASAEPPQPKAQESGQMIVPFIIKADVSGSAEAVSAYIQSLASPLVAPQILNSGVGDVHESDIELASAAQGHIIAFNLPPNADATAAAAAAGVRVLENNIIYRVLDDVKAVLEEKLPPVISQRVLGEAEVTALFDIKLKGKNKMWIAGCKVRNGVIGNGSRARVMRGTEKVYDGKITSLKNVKKDVQEMRKGTECGMGFEDWEGFETGDQVQTYEEISEKRKL